MDPLSDFLDGPRARGAFALRMVMAPPWALTVADGSPLTLVPNLAGSCWFRPEGGQPRELGTGDVLLVRAPTAYRLSSASELEPTITIGPGQECLGADGRDLSDEFASGVRTWGNDPDGGDRMLVGSYLGDGEVGRLLLSALPPHLVVRSPAPHVVDLLDAELSRDGIGAGSMLDRLLDLLLIATVRTWAAGPDPHPTWLRASRDEAVHTAVGLIHDRPEHAWTLDELARTCRLSRAAFSRRFHDVVGAPPMTYLTQLRLARGADLLRDDRLTLEAVARRVGYGSGFSFSAAFKRDYGVSPADYRRGRRTT